MMPRIPTGGILLGDVSHVGIAVFDVEETATAMAESLGIGPFRLREIHTPRERGSIRGEPRAYTLRFAYARSGPVTVELIAPAGGETIYDEFLRERGPGLHHLGYPMGGLLDEELERWEEAGYRADMVHRREDPRYGWAYLDTGLGFLAEILCDPPLGWWESRTLARDLAGPLGAHLRPSEE